jgi:hypothetical protein
MNDKDFDQIFSDKLNEESLFSGADDNWQKLNFRLDLIPPAVVVSPPAPQVMPTAPTIGGHQGWMYAAMSALTVGNVWLWLQMKDVSRQNEGLQKAVSAVQLGRKDTVYRIDTVYQKVYLIGNQSNSGKSVPITQAEYSALSAVSTKSIESKSFKNEVVIDRKNQQNNTHASLNVPQASSKTIYSSRNNPLTGTQKSEMTSLTTDNWGNSAAKKSEMTARTTDNWDNSAAKKSEMTTRTTDNWANSAAQTSDLKSTKSVDKTIATIVENSIPVTKNIDNSNNNAFVTTDASLPKVENNVAEQNNILRKATIVLLPLDSRPLSEVAALTKVRERMSVADAIEPIRVHKRSPLFASMSMPEINLGLVVAAGLPERKSTNGIGIGIEVGLSQHWSLIASGEKHSWHFDMGDKDNKFRLPPEPMVPNGHKLRRLRGEFKDERLSVGAKYVFLTHKKYRPYVTAQHVWKHAPNSMVDFEYETLTGDNENFKQTLEGQSFTNIWQVGSGVTGDLNRRISWHAGLNYMFDFNKQHSNTAPITLRGGVFYRL